MSDMSLIKVLIGVKMWTVKNKSIIGPKGWHQ